MKNVTTILFVENDQVALTMYQKRLQREGFHVETAEDGIAALKVLSEMTPDIVVLDLMLPKFSGKDVFDYMRADMQFKNVPVIIFSNAPKSEWPKDIEGTPTQALPKSEANLSSLLEMIRQMTSAAQSSNAMAQPAPEPEPENVPPLKLHMASDTHPADSTAMIAEEEDNVVETTEEFLQDSLAKIPEFREHCLAYIKAPTTEAGRRHLAELQR